MKRNLDDENSSFSHKKIYHRHQTQHQKDNLPCIIILDSSLSSNLLSTKIADIPHRSKYETIIKPLFEYSFGTTDEDHVWNELNEDEEKENYENQNNIDDEEDEIINFINLLIGIDWIRDRTFIYDQIFNLVIEKLDTIALKFGLWNDRSFVLASIENYGTCPDHYIIQYENDREVMKVLVGECGANICFASDELRSDYEIVKLAVQEGADLVYASEELRNNKEIVMIAVGKNWDNLSSASKELKNDFDVVKTAVQQHGLALQYASEELKNNKEIVMISLELDTSSYEFASTQLKSDKDVIIKAFSKTLYIVNGVSQKYRNDRDVLLAISKVNGIGALDYASENLQNDREIVIQAVSKDPLALQYACPELRNDREIVRIAVMKYGMCLKYASNKLQDDYEIAELAIQSSVKAQGFISPRLNSDTNILSLLREKGFTNIPRNLLSNKEVILKSLKINKYNFSRISNELQNDRDFTLQAVSINYLVLKFVRDEFKKDREIVWAAITQKGEAILDASNMFFNDEEIILKAAETCDNHELIYKQISKRLKGNRAFNLQLVKICGKFFECLPRKYKLDREFTMDSLPYASDSIISSIPYHKIVSDRVLAMRFVKLNGLFLSWMNLKQRNDREIVSLAVKQNKEAFEFASLELRNDKEFLEFCKNY